MAGADGRSAAGLLAAGQLSLLGLLAVCVAVTPRFAIESDEGGVSNYGVHAATVTPYSAAFVLGAVLTALAARSLPPGATARRGVAAGLVSTAALYLVVLASTYPYRHGRLPDELHLAAAGLLAADQLVLLTWMVIRWPNLRHVAAWCIWAAGSGLAVITLAGALHLLLVAQFVMGVGSALVTVSVVSDMDRVSD